MKSAAASIMARRCLDLADDLLDGCQGAKPVSRVCQLRPSDARKKYLAPPQSPPSVVPCRQNQHGIVNAFGQQAIDGQRN